MKIIDDLKRDVSLEDYRRIMNELVREFSDPRIGFYSYGKIEAPRSDLDIVAIPREDVPAREIRHLHGRLSAFTVGDSTKRYVFGQNVKICPSSVWSKIFYVYPPIDAASWLHLSGSPIDLPAAPETKEFGFIRLMELVFVDLYEIISMIRSSKVSLRKLCSRCNKIYVFTLPLLIKQYGETAMVELRQSLDSAKDVWTGLHSLNGGRERTVKPMLEECRNALKKILDRLCEDFLSKAIRMSDPWANCASNESGRFYVPPLYHCHRQAYARAARANSELKWRLEHLGPKYDFRITNERYNELLKKQMDAVSDYETCMSRYGVSTFNIRVAGVWHAPGQFWRYRKEAYLGALKRYFRRAFYRWAPA